MTYAFNTPLFPSALAVSVDPFQDAEEGNQDDDEDYDEEDDDYDDDDDEDYDEDEEVAANNTLLVTLPITKKSVGKRQRSLGVAW